MRKIFSVIMILVLVYFFYFSFIIPFETKEIKIYLTVDNILGFNVTDDALVFGTVPPGGVGGKDIIINNDADVPQFVHITTSGEVSDWMMVSDNNFLILSEAEKNVTVKIFVPEDAEFKHYSGTLKLKFKKII